MIYKDFFTATKYEDVWGVLNSYYREPESLKGLYKRLFYTIRNLPVDEAHASTPLKMFYDFEGMIHAESAPDPIEWLTGREVALGKVEGLSDSQVAAHLLYWSTLYDFRTQTRYHKDCLESWEDKLNGTFEPSYNTDKCLSLKCKQVYYWKDAAAGDTAWDWSYILDFMRKRIEYHIGYHRFTDRFANSKHYVSRMELCSNLLELAAADYYDTNGGYVNTRNAKRFVGGIFDEYHYNKLLERNTDDFILSELRRAKAYHILWKFLDHNLTYWRD